MSFLRLLSFYPAGQDQEGAVGQRGGLRLMGLRGGDCLEDQRVLEVEGVQRREVSEFKRGFLLPLRYVSRGYADLDVPTTIPGGPAAIPAAPVLSPLPHYCPGWPSCYPAPVLSPLPHYCPGWPSCYPGSPGAISAAPLLSRVAPLFPRCSYCCRRS
jgi:hypothetical protein